MISGKPRHNQFVVSADLPQLVQAVTDWQMVVYVGRIGVT